MEGREIPMSINNNSLFYSDFATRLGAGLLDALIMCPVWIGIAVINSYDVNIQYFTILLNIIFVLAYMVYLPKRYGGTPGKLISGLKIIKMDGSDIDWKAAFLRYSISLSIAVLTVMPRLYALTQVDAITYNSLDWLDQATYLQSFSKGIDKMLLALNLGWVLAEIIVFFTNDRRRALHDMVAGTVVIRKAYDTKIKQYMANPDGENPDVAKFA